MSIITMTPFGNHTWRKRGPVLIPLRCLERLLYRHCHVPHPQH